MNNIFVVSTPLQLINAIEAKNHFKADADILVVLYSIIPSKQAFLNLLDLESWTEVYFFQISDIIYRVEGKKQNNFIIEITYEYLELIKQFRRRIGFDKLIRSLPEAENLFLGNYLKGYMRHLAFLLKHNKLLVIDDGTDTLRINDLRKQSHPVTLTKPNPTALKAFKGRLRQRHIDWIPYIPDKLNFFSTYDIDVKAGDSIIKNTYCHLKLMNKTQSFSDEIYFLGEPLCEDGYFSREYFYTFMGNIRNYFQSNFKYTNIFYIPHPRESEKSVMDIHKKFGFTVRRFNLPIEVELLKMKNPPKVLASFFCTALDNCRLLFGGNMNIKAFFIENEDLYEGYGFVQEIYNYMETKTCKNFEVVKLSSAFSQQTVLK